MPRTALYRHFGQDGMLLYVGISLSAVNRLSQHKEHARWFEQISKIDIQWFPSAEEARAAERLAIQTEDPMFNKTWKRKAAASATRREPEIETAQRIEEPLMQAYSVPDAAKVFGISQSLTWALIKDRKINVVKLGKRTLVTKREIERVLEVGC